MTTRCALSLIAALAVTGPVLASVELVQVPPFTGRVVDTTQTLTPDQVRSLDAQLAAFEQSKGAQIAVLMVASTVPEPIEAFGIRVAESWKAGRKGIDDGIIVIVAKSDRAVRIEVGYGLEGAVPDATANRLIDEYFVPRFRDGEFYSGLNDGLQRLMNLVAGEPLPPARRESTNGGSLQTYFALFLFLVFAGGGLLRAMLGRVGGASAVGSVAGIAAWLIAGSALIAVVLAIAAFVFTLFGGAGTGLGGWRGGRYRGGWGGGGISSGGFRGGGGGGFGGGGASGRW